MSIPSGGGCCKSVVLSDSLALGESVHSSCLPLVCHVKFFQCLRPVANKSIPLKHVLGLGGEGVRGVI